MKVLVLGATGRTGRLIVRFRPGERPSPRGPVRSKASADLPGVDMIEGDARDEGALTCSLVVKGAESPRLMHDPEAVPPMQRIDFSRVQETTYRRTI
jgi:uncharacterized protein YbjT (DUF2867 family)